MKRKCACGYGQLTKDGNKFINGHNSTFRGRRHSEETKKRFSEIAKNRSPISQRTKRKIGKANKGKKRSESARKKLSIAKTAERHHNWKGGIMQNASGRIFIRQGIKGYKARSRVVMEEKLGRKLKSNELVHHINGDPSDDRIENLVVLSRSKHVTGHNIGRIHSEETKEKIGTKSRGRVHPYKGMVNVFKHSEESKKKISETLKKTWKQKRRGMNEN